MPASATCSMGELLHMRGDGSIDLCDGHHWITLPKAWVDKIVSARQHVPNGWVGLKEVECGPIKIEPVPKVSVSVEVTITPIQQDGGPT